MTTQRTLLRGGYVHTPGSNSTGPHPTALCVEDGHVVWTGDDDASAHFADGADRIVELDGRLVTPAFVDSHVHLSQTGIAASSVDFSDTSSLAEALDALAAHARTAPLPVVLGLNWDETRWPENRPPTRSEVDRALDGRPAYLARVDAHSAVLSTGLLDKLPEVADTDGWSADGFVRREANVVARGAVFGLLPDSAHEDAIARALHDAAAHGIAMVHENGAPGDSPAEDFARIRAVRAAQPWLPEVVGYWGRLDGVDEALALDCAGAAGDLCVDGAVGSRTAAMRSPYTDDATTRGALYLDADEIARHVVACTRAGIQGGFHVIGDAAADATVEGFRRAAEVVGQQALVRSRHRLEHLEMVDPEQMQLLASYGVTASVQPAFDAWWGGDDDLYAQRLGVERALAMNPLASLARAGIALAFGSDSPVTPMDPWGAVRAAAWHHNEAERITVRAAFNAHTRGGWRAAARDEGGVIDLGTPASIAVWDVPGELVVQTPDERVAAWSTDPRAGVPHLPDLHPDQDLPTCVLTLVHGHVAYEREGAL
jgi:predicted amidohydrolase YtcJ